MAKKVIFLFIFLFIFVMVLSTAHSISLRELISRYIFSHTSAEISVVNHADFMVDKDNNGVNDTLVIELTTNSTDGNFIFVVNLFDQYTLTNVTNMSLAAGISSLNATFSSIYLTQPNFNYSIKIYNLTHSLKYREDKIPTQVYRAYEKAFDVLDVNDYKDGKSHVFNITLNSSVNGTFKTVLFLHYNNSAVLLKADMPISSSLNSLVYRLDNKTIQSKHLTGSLNLTLMVGNRVFRLDNSGNLDFRDYAESAYISGFSDVGVDTDADAKYDILQITADTWVANGNYYSFTAVLHDLFGNIAEIKNESFFLNQGSNAVALSFNGSGIYSKKLNGPFVVKQIALYESNVLVDSINDAYTTNYYEFNEFDMPNLPDLAVFASVSDGYHYGVNNVSINISFRNTGSMHSFNVLTEIFDNSSLYLSKKSNVIGAGSEVPYQIEFLNFSDFEIAAIADAQNSVDEADEANNAAIFVIKLNHVPELEGIGNITINATKKIIVNLSAHDSDGDNLSFKINHSKLSAYGNLFEWNTTVNDSGHYHLAATASDGFLSDYGMFGITIINTSKPALENDLDKDGISDELDKVIGNRSSINSSTFNFEIHINGSSNLSRYFNQTLKVRFLSNKAAVIEFDFDFSKHALNLTNVTIDKQRPGAKGSLLVKGLNLHGSAKTAYVDWVDKRKDRVCIKDKQISSINEISAKCNKKDEYLVYCNFLRFFVRKVPYTCSHISGNKYMIKELSHSGTVQV